MWELEKRLETKSGLSLMCQVEISPMCQVVNLIGPIVTIIVINALTDIIICISSIKRKSES